MQTTESSSKTLYINFANLCLLFKSLNPNNGLMDDYRIPQADCQENRDEHDFGMLDLSWALRPHTHKFPAKSSQTNENIA